MTAKSELIGDPNQDTVWVEHISLIDRIPRWVAMLALAVIVIGIWDLATARMGWVSPIILPSPGETLDDLMFVGKILASGGYMLEALWTTTRTVFWAFLIAASIGFSLGVLVGETKFGERAVMPYLVAIATFPIIVSTAAGFYAASENERMLFKAMGASRWQTLIRLKLPTGLPYIFTGMKIAAVGVMAGAITGEFLGGGKGFGALIRESASMLDTPRVFSLILYLSLLGLALFFLVAWVQKRLVFWNKADRPGGVG
jgi:NitT/TauT family transport system permease protein